MPSQVGPASNEEPAAITALSEIRRSLAEARQRYIGFARRGDQIYSEIQASRGEPPSEEELAAIGCNLEERQLYMGALHQPYMALYHHGDRINNEIQAMQAARGVAALLRRGAWAAWPRGRGTGRRQTVRQRHRIENQLRDGDLT